MTAEMAGRGKFTQTVANHVLGDVNRNMAAAIMHGNRMAQKLGENRRSSAPGADNFLVP
jgi:hypothetical protein